MHLYIHNHRKNLIELDFKFKLCKNLSTSLEISTLCCSDWSLPPYQPVFPHLHFPSLLLATKHNTFLVNHVQSNSLAIGPIIHFFKLCLCSYMQDSQLGNRGDKYLGQMENFHYVFRLEDILSLFKINRTLWRSCTIRGLGYVCI